MARETQRGLSMEAIKVGAGQKETAQRMMASGRFLFESVSGSKLRLEIDSSAAAIVRSFFRDENIVNMALAKAS